MIASAPTPSVELDPRAVALAITVPGEPVAKERPRVTRTKGGKSITRTPEATATWEQVIAIHARQALRGAPTDDASLFGASFVFVSGDRIRRDIDNLVKLGLDSLNGVLWKDDSQVLELHARLHRGGAMPRTEILVYRIHPNGDPHS